MLSSQPRRVNKMLIGGKYTRSESGLTWNGPDGRFPQASRKDCRNAVVAARAGATEWQALTPYMRGQILYRLAEVLAGRTEQLTSELAHSGLNRGEARTQVKDALETLVWHAGWADKLAQVLGSSNQVGHGLSSTSTPVGVGIVVSASSGSAPLKDLLDSIGATLAAGSSVIALAPATGALPAVTVGESIGVSDFPPGVVNILTGERASSLRTLAGHGDVQSLDITGVTEDEDMRETRQAAGRTLKRLLLPGAGEGKTLSMERIRVASDTRSIWQTYGY